MSTKSAFLFCLILITPFIKPYAQTTVQEPVATTTTVSLPDSNKCREQLSLYREYYKIKMYAYALPHWRWMFLNCPAATQNIYIDGIKIMSAFVDSTKDASMREKYIDTLLMVHDQRIKNFGREGYVLGRKAIDALTYRPTITAQVLPWFGKSIELQGNQSEGAVLVHYLNSTIQQANAGLIDKSEIFNVYDKVIAVADYNIKASADDAKDLNNWVNIKANIETMIEPLASCSDLVKIYEKKFKETPNDITLLKNITSMLERRDCTKQGDLFYHATANLHKLEPSAQSAYLMGKLSIQNNQLGKAAEYMSQAAELYTDKNDKIKALYALASIQSSERNFSQARNTSYKIIQLNPNEGKAYMLIGDLYAMSAGMCTGDDLGGKSVFWAAIDKYIKAKSVDNSVEQEANEKISQYSRYYPPSADLFFRDLMEGKSFSVGCWINETTTIRAGR